MTKPQWNQWGGKDASCGLGRSMTQGGGAGWRCKKPGSRGAKKAGGDPGQPGAGGADAGRDLEALRSKVRTSWGDECAEIGAGSDDGGKRLEDRELLEGCGKVGKHPVKVYSQDRRPSALRCRWGLPGGDGPWKPWKTAGQGGRSAWESG